VIVREGEKKRRVEAGEDGQRSEKGEKRMAKEKDSISEKNTSPRCNTVKCSV
jgi:hypothetical protein